MYMLLNLLPEGGEGGCKDTIYFNILAMLYQTIFEVYYTPTTYHVVKIT